MPRVQWNKPKEWYDSWVVVKLDFDHMIHNVFHFLTEADALEFYNHYISDEEDDERQA